jgi:diacylglycerol O-acyltransferase / wax synthase
MTKKETDYTAEKPLIELGDISATDSIFLRGESELKTRQTGHSIYLLDSIPQWDRFIAVWERASRLLPPLHHRVVHPPGPGSLPQWQFDPDLDLRFHVRRLALPAPGTLRQLFEIAENDGMVPFDHARPLWQATLVEGLEGNRAALLLKFHHLWVDGKTNIEVGRLIFGTEPDSDLDLPMPPLPTPGPASEDRAFPLGKVMRGARESASKGLSAYSSMARVMSNPRRAISEGSELVASARRVLSPPTAQRSPVFAGRSFKSRYDVLDVPFTDLRRAVKSVGCSINDGYMAGIAGGIRLYLESLNSPIDDVAIGMPLSTGSEDKVKTGNQISAAILTFPVSLADPVERLHRVQEIVKSHRQERAGGFLMNVTPFLTYIPEQFFIGAMSRVLNLLDFMASQVPGMREPRYIAGAQLTHYYGFGPRTGMTAFIGMMTHLDNCCIGVHSDPAAITDPDLFMECLGRGFDEILALGRKTSGRKKSPASTKAPVRKTAPARKKTRPKARASAATRKSR